MMEEIISPLQVELTCLQRNSPATQRNGLHLSQVDLYILIRNPNTLGCQSLPLITIGVAN